MANIEWNKAAIQDLDSLDKPVAHRILKKIDWLSKNFEKIVPEPLAGQFKGTYKSTTTPKKVLDPKRVFNLSQRAQRAQRIKILS